MKYIKLLKTLSNRQLKEFDKFLKSPYFNQSNLYTNFHDYVLKNQNKVFEGKLNKGELFSVFYPNEPYCDKKLRDRLTHSFTLLKEFISIQNFRQNIFEVKKNLLLGIRGTNLKDIFLDELDLAEKEIEAYKYKEEEFYYRKYQLGDILNTYFETNSPLSEKLKLNIKIPERIDNVIKVFFIVMMKEYFKLLNSETLVKTEYNHKFYEDIISLISTDEKYYKEVPIINLLIKFIKLIKMNYEDKFVHDLEYLLQTNQNKLSRDIYEAFCIELYNYYKRVQAKGNREYGEKSFEWMKKLLEEKILLDSIGYMAAHTYINLAATALRVNKIKWAENFIEEYKERLHEDEKGNAYNYNISVILYLKGSKAAYETKDTFYNQSLKILSKVKGEDFYYVTRIKNQELKIYYELNNIENALSLIDSYTHYLNRNKLIPEDLKLRYINFVRSVEKLIKLKLSFDELEKQMFIDNLKKMDEIGYRNWILEKCEELS